MISKPLLLQSIKSNWVLWLACSLTMGIMLCIINTLLNMQTVTTFNIDTMEVLRYQVVLMINNLSLSGLIEALGFNSSTIDIWVNFDMVSMMNNMYYTVGCMLIPMIYVVITANRLLVDQVDRGSMAYVLSTPTRRSTVVTTQIVYLVTTIFLMFLVQALAGIISSYILIGEADVRNTLLLNFGSAVTILALSGICFLGSAYFNYSKYSYALSGGLSVFFFLTKVLGIFGDEMFVTVGMGVESMRYFNYLSLLNLLDTQSITDNTTTFIWKLAILAGIALVTYIASIFVFNKKDLSL